MHKPLAIAVLALLGLSAAQVRAEPPKWGAHIDLEGKIGSKRDLGEADMFVPLAQNARTLLFGNLRARVDDNASQEGNFGVGLRHMLDAGWNLGAYGYFDRRRTEMHNYFSQATIGLEALSLDWDFRANSYVPTGRRVYEANQFNTAELSGTTVTFRGGEERAMGGFDAEIGWRAPIFGPEDGRQFRLYAGGYRFAEDNLPTVAGPRLRAEFVLADVPGLWQGGRLSLGAEWQRDTPRGSQGFLSARLRIPLQWGSAPARAATPMERRMTDPIVRDVDVVAQAGTFGATEVVTAKAGGGAFTVLNSATTAGANLATEVNNAGDNSTVLLSGSFQTGTGTVSMRAGQTLTGTLTVQSASGRTATVNTGATINASNTGNYAILMNGGGGTISGLNIHNSSSGGSVSRAIFVADGVTGVNILNNRITATQGGNVQAQAIAFGNNTSGTLRGNTVTATGTGSASGTRALVAANTTTITAANNSFSASGAASAANDVLVLSGAGATFTAGSTGNTRGNGLCSGTSASGAVSFTNGTSCP